MTCMLTLADISGDTWSEDITAKPKVLGRADGADIRLDHASVSRQHCKFWLEPEGCFVEDCGSTNGTYVNGLRVQREKIAPGDSILVGRFELLVEDKQLVQATIDLPEQPPSRVVLLDQRAEEKHLARLIHQRLTPSRRMTLPGLIVEVLYFPSGMLGGDAFDSFELSNRWILSVFDPLSHGVKATMNSMLLRAELHRWIALTPEPARCLQWINSELCLLGANDLYVSAVVASWFPRTQTLVCASAGEHPPLLWREGKVRQLGDAAGGLPLGVLPTEHYTEQLVQLKTGDRVFLFTDGVGEAIRGEREAGIGTHELVRRLTASDSATLTEQLHAALPGTTDTLVDDVLLVGCEVVSD